jgi:hypothetical protein
MEELFLGGSQTVAVASGYAPVAWRDLRDWLALVERAGQLKRIDAAVDPDEELAAITFMAGRTAVARSRRSRARW